MFTTNPPATGKCASALNPPASPDRWSEWCERGLLVTFLALSLVFNLAIQPGYGPDEPRHYRYVQRLAEKGALPLRVAGGELDGAHTLHPPLYYALLTPLYWITRGARPLATLRVLKLVSPLLLGAALLLFAAALRRCFPDRPFIRLGALATVALLPEFQLEAGVLNNDSLAILLGAALLYQCVRVAREEARGPGAAVVAGLIMAAFANTKATAFTLAPLWLFALCLRDRNLCVKKPAWWRDLALGYGLLLLLGTWWYLRNVNLYGQPVPLDFGSHNALRPRHLDTGAPMSPLEVYLTGMVVPLGLRAAVGLFQSFWVQIDWVPEGLRPSVFGFLGVLCLTAIAGWGRRFWEHRRGRPATFGTVTALAGAGLLLVAAHTWYIATFLHLGFYQGGRYLMPAVFGAGVLLAGGWEGLLPEKARPRVLLVLVGLLLAFNAICLRHLVAVLNPTYVLPIENPRHPLHEASGRLPVPRG
ncbi:MAG: hypothetical protein HY320_00545 [Armatimonadetes bacterium]|nr:hypothetical protein [Armatimonadota bacterium]